MANEQYIKESGPGTTIEPAPETGIEFTNGANDAQKLHSAATELGGAYTGEETPLSSVIGEVNSDHFELPSKVNEPVTQKPDLREDSGLFALSHFNKRANEKRAKSGGVKNAA